DQIRNWAGTSNGADPSSVDLSEGGASPRSTTSQEGLISNSASLRAETVSRTENEVAASKSEPKFPELPKPSPTQAPSPGASTRTPWVPASMRPASSAPRTQTDLPHSLSAGTPPSGAQAWAPAAAYQRPSPMPWITHFDPDPPRGRWASIRGVL